MIIYSVKHVAIVKTFCVFSLVQDIRTAVVSEII